MKGSCCCRRRSFPNVKHSATRRATSFLLYSFIASVSSLPRPSAALVHLRGGAFSFTFVDAPAHFAVPVDGSGVCGSLHLSDPINACSQLRNNRTGAVVGVSAAHHPHTRFVLISRGVCSFERKVRNAQDGGFEAAIIYDNQEKSSLYSSE